MILTECKDLKNVREKKKAYKTRIAGMQTDLRYMVFVEMMNRIYVK